MPTTVLLLRSPSEDGGGPDKYEEAFTVRGYRTLSVPVLETVHKNLDALADVVRNRGRLPNAAGARYAGVIVTSARACEAWRIAAQQLSADPETQGAGSESTWSSIPFYAVGGATAAALRDVPASPYAPRDIRGGAESGTAEKLARFILSDLPAPQPGDQPHRLLYLTGDKNRDTLPRILAGGGVELDNLQVYATQGSSTFEQDLKAGLGQTDHDEEERWWIVHFAPSAAKAVAPTLKRYFDIPDADRASPPTKRRVRIAAIGPTTSTFLREELRIEVAVVAEKPTPEALSDGIADWDRKHSVVTDTPAVG